MKPSPALVISCLALFIALSTSSIAEPLRGAATKKVGGAQIKRSAITSKHVKNRSLKRADFARNALPQDGAPGASGARGPAGPRGLRGLTGPRGPGAQRIEYRLKTPNNTTSPVTTFKVGPWTLSASCASESSLNQQTLLVTAQGPGRISNWYRRDGPHGPDDAASVTLDDGSATVANPETAFFQREFVAGQALLTAPGTLWTLDYYGAIETQPTGGFCEFRAVAVPAS